MEFEEIAMKFNSVFKNILEFKFVEENRTIKSLEENTPRKSLHEASILVAEDNVVNQLLVKKFLMKWNAGKLVIASDGQEALDQYNSGYFNIVLMDLQMPKMNGFAVSKAIRNHPDPDKRNVPILAITGSSFNEVKAEMKDAGINDYIPKPFISENLYAMILNYLKLKIRR